MLVLVGSETGNALDLAELAVERLRRQRIQVDIKNFGEATPESIRDHEDILVVCSTTGQGAVPRNAQPLWNMLLRRSVPRDLLVGVRVRCFGLGDSVYPKFNWAIRKIHARLLQLGASESCPRGEGDERSPDGYEAAFDQWLDLAVPPQHNTEKGLLPPLHEVKVLPLDVTWDSVSYNGKVEPEEISLRVRENRSLTPSTHFQDVRHLVLDGVPVNAFNVGDVLTLSPKNTDEAVDIMLQSQGWTDLADRILEIDGHNVGTLHSFLKSQVDLNCVPRRSFFSLASYFCSDPKQSERMAEFCTELQDLWDYANRPRRSLSEVVAEFDSLKIPLAYIADILPSIRPRQFSIASPPSWSHIELCVAIVRYRTKIRRIRHGLATHWITTLAPGTEVQAKVEHQGLPLSKRLHKPIVIVATGTGIAPARSWLLSGLIDSIPKTLIYGCRFHDKDFLYGNEWAGIPNLRVIPAFSREGGGYVQQQIEFHPELDIENAVVFVCGSSGQMPRAVREAFIDSLKRKGYAHPEDVLAQKEREANYIEDTW